MARIETRMPYPEGVTAGGTAVFKLPVGRRYHELVLTYAGVTLAQLNEIRVIANGKPIHRYSASVRDALNQFDGRAAAAGLLVIPFDRYNLKNRVGEEETALNTDSFDQNGRGIRSLTVEVDIDGAAAAPVLSMTASQSEKLQGGAGTILHVNKFPRSAAGAGELQISDIPFGGVTTQALNRAVFVPSVGTISDMKVERDTYVIWERSTTLNEMLQVDGVRSPQSGYFIIDKTEKGFAGDPVALAGFADFRYRLECSAAAQIDCFIETLGALGD